MDPLLGNVTSYEIGYDDAEWEPVRFDNHPPANLVVLRIPCGKPEEPESLFDEREIAVERLMGLIYEIGGSPSRIVKNELGKATAMLFVKGELDDKTFQRIIGEMISQDSSLSNRPPRKSQSRDRGTFYGFKHYG